MTHRGKRTRTVYDAASGVTTTYYADGVFSRLKSDLAVNVVEAEGETGVIRCRYDAGGRVVGDLNSGMGYGYTASRMTR